MSEPAIFDDIRKALAEHDVVLFMKGSPQAPQCGFSSTVVKILDVLDVDYASVNVLASNVVRDGIKAFSDWPTIPQLYVKGEFVGGCDIIREMYESGELQEFLTEKASRLRPERSRQSNLKRRSSGPPFSFPGAASMLALGGRTCAARSAFRSPLLEPMPAPSMLAP